MMVWSLFRGGPDAGTLQPAISASLLGLLVLAAVILPPIALPFVIALALTAPLASRRPKPTARALARSAPLAHHIRTRGPPA